MVDDPFIVASNMFKTSSIHKYSSHFNCETEEVGDSSNFQISSDNKNSLATGSDNNASGSHTHTAKKQKRKGHA
jgi:hypothetical protein